MHGNCLESRIPFPPIPTVPAVFRGNLINFQSINESFSIKLLNRNIARIANAVPFTLYSRVTMNDEIVVLNCQKCNQCPTGHKSLGSFIQGVLSMSLSSLASLSSLSILSLLSSLSSHSLIWANIKKSGKYKNSKKYFEGSNFPKYSGKYF